MARREVRGGDEGRGLGRHHGPIIPLARRRTLVLHPPLELGNNRLACEVVQEGLGVDGNLRRERRRAWVSGCAAQNRFALRASSWGEGRRWATWTRWCARAAEPRTIDMAPLDVTRLFAVVIVRVSHFRNSGILLRYPIQR
jgi:hypothetical protein